MLSLQLLREETDFVKSRLEVKNFDQIELIDQIVSLDSKRRDLQKKLDDSLAEANKLAKEIGQLFKSGQVDEANEKKALTSDLKKTNQEGEKKLNEVKEELQNLLLQVPNLPSTQVPVGKSPEDNEVVLTHGELPDMDADALPHWEITEKYNLIDFEAGVKVTGAGFPVYKGKGARLQRGLIQFFLDKAVDMGYEEVIPPILVNADSGYATGQLPDKEGQMYEIQKDGLYVIPTAEVPITNLYRDIIIAENEFPIKNVGYTPCFRREAGSYGKDVRGLNRLHQFDKVEIVQIAHPKKSYEVLEQMQSYVQSLLQDLELPYRVLKLCGGDMSFTSALTYDMEVYSAAQKRWLEVSSVSNFENYQANRLKLRFRNADGKTELAHTLNGSALALPRIVAALLENNQTPNGVKMPKVLHPYLNFETIDA